MKYLSEYRDPEVAAKYLEEIKKTVTRPWTIMEVCGGQTHSLVKNGILNMLPKEINMVHGPGCPVCVTPLSLIDKAIFLAEERDVILCSFGDMLRVPGSGKSLLRMGVTNYSILASHVLVPPAIRAVMDDPESRIEAFLAAGHVCTIMGTSEYGPLVDKYNIPMVVTGFEPIDLLQGILMTVKQLEAGEAKLENQYTRMVRPEGNANAMDAIYQVFEITDRTWRGLSEIPESGYRVRDAYAAYDATLKFNVDITFGGCSKR